MKNIQLLFLSALFLTCVPLISMQIDEQLFDAISLAKLVEVQKLVRAGADINAVSSQKQYLRYGIYTMNYSVLDWTITNGAVDILNYLLSLKHLKVDYEKALLSSTCYRSRSTLSRWAPVEVFPEATPDETIIGLRMKHLLKVHFKKIKVN